MPFYDYECKTCQKKFESFHGVNETLTQCPKCNENTAIKVPGLITASVKDSQRQEAGQRVREYIEDTRQLLKDSLSREEVK